MNSLILLAVLSLTKATPEPPVVKDTLSLRGKTQELQLYGKRGGPAAIVASGDGGWLHLAPQAARLLAGHGYFVVGFDSKHYLTSFTEGQRTLTVDEVPGDIEALVEYAARGAPGKPLLVGVSEGAGLLVLAATDPKVQSKVSGVLGLSLGDINELAWRLRDSLIYLTHKVPNEPTFSVASMVDRVAPLPLATIHSTRDPFVPLEQIQAIMKRAKPPSKLWLVEADDHNFSGASDAFAQRLVEALQWMGLPTEPSK